MKKKSQAVPLGGLFTENDKTYRPSQVFAHGAFTHTTAVQLIESGFFYAYDCKGVGTRPRTGSGVLMERSGAEESRWHEVDVKPRRVGTAGRPESAE